MVEKLIDVGTLLLPHQKYPKNIHSNWVFKKIKMGFEMIVLSTNPLAWMDISLFLYVGKFVDNGFNNIIVYTIFSW